MAWFAISLILPVWAAYAPVAYCDRAARNDVATRFFRLCLATGVGVGIASCTYFLWLFFVGTPGKNYHACELAAFAVVGLVGRTLLRGLPRLPRLPRISHDRRTDIPVCPNSRTFPGQTRMSVLLLCLSCRVGSAAVGVVGIYWQTPLGDWDAWTIWNQRARFFFRAGPQWRQAFSPEFAHTDYPLLLPSSIARCWSYLGTDCPWAPWLLGTLFTFATVGVLMSAVCRLRSRSQGLLAGLVLLGMVPFLQRGALQYADVPLSFFFLSAVALFAHYDASQRPGRGMLVLSGLLAALAAWTKNEGALFLLVLPAARCAATWRRRGAARSSGSLSAGRPELCRCWRSSHCKSLPCRQ